MAFNSLYSLHSFFLRYRHKNTLLDKIYAVDQDINALTKENSILQPQYNLLTNITAPNTPSKDAPFSLARNWKSNVDFFETRQTALATKQYRIQQKLRKKQKEMEEMKEMEVEGKNENQSPESADDPTSIIIIAHS